MSIYKKLSEKYKISEADIKKICDSPFLCVKEKLRETDFNEDVGNTVNFNLKYLGMFHVSNKRREAIKLKINGFKTKDK